jgi:cysteine-rich repeat protein
VVDEGEFCDDANQAEGDGCSSACLVETVALTSNNLVITEIMYNPSAVFDAHGEWFEVLNTGAGTLDLAGLVVTNGAGESHTLAPAGQLLLAAGGQAVLGRSADLASNGGLVLDYVYATSEDLSLQLENAGDTLSLTFEGTLVDAVSYDNGVEFPLANGAALVLSNQAQDTLSNDAGTNWCVATSPYGAGDWGTPGGVNDLCPGCGNGACEETESCQSCPADCSACPDGCSPLSFGGCAGCACEACVCGIDSFCCDVVWDGDCVTKCDVDCGGCESSEESGSESGSEG